MNAPTRGERNNNPLNIILTHTLWNGMVQEQTDSRFIIFIAPEYGYRAAARIIRKNYFAGRTTINAIITAWAPDVENDTQAYIADVAFRVGSNAYQPLEITRNKGDPSQLLSLLKAMTFHENGRCIYPDETLQLGMDLEC